MVSGRNEPMVYLILPRLSRAGRARASAGLRASDTIPGAVTVGRLLLAPADPQADPPARASLLDALRDMGLAGAELDAGGDIYAAGERFLDLVSFMGCSPHVDFEPPAPGSEAFCHLALLGPWPEPRLFLGVNTVAPHCPQCGARIAHWRARLKRARDRITCPRCHQSTPAWGLRWRRFGGAARTAVEVRNVFPKEALPAPELLAGLARVTGGDWGYFYIQPEA